MSYEVAWAAGLWEGEGCFTYHTNPGHTPRCRLQMTDEAVVRRFHAAVGFGKVYGPYQNKAPIASGVRKVTWCWDARGAEDMRRLLELLRPGLSERRIKRAEELLTRESG